MSTCASVLGVRVTDISIAELMFFLEDALSLDEKVIVSYTNIHALNTAYEIPGFRDYLNKANVNFCDGFGIKMAAMLVGQTIQNRHTPPDFIGTICDMASKHDARVFFLGGSPGVADAAANHLKSQFHDLNIQSHHGWFEKKPGSVENSQVIDQIRKFNTDILFVGFGMPLQEDWISQNLDTLDIKIVFSVGALFDYISGNIWRAPKWVTANGFEWLARLAAEPRRLWKRYVIGNPLFFWRVILHHWFGYPLPK